MSDKKNSKKGLVVFIVIIGVSVVLGLGTLFTYLFKNGNIDFSLMPSFGSNPITNPFPFTVNTTRSAGSKKIKPAGALGKEYIAALYVEGTIEKHNSEYDQEWLLETIKTLKEDKKNIAIAMFIDSPGGSVYEADEVYLALQDYKTEGKTIYVYMGSLAASGGYYIACPADRIYANRNTLTGSIGVIAGQSMDLTGLMEKIGVKSETIHAGKNKNMMNYNEPFSDEQKAIMQSIADECYDQFTGIVSTCRNLPIEKVHEIADGRIYTAKQALELELIDQIDSWDNMMEDLKDELDKPNCSVQTFKVEKKTSFANMFMETKAKAAVKETAAKLGIPEKLYEEINSTSNYPAYIYRQ